MSTENSKHITPFDAVISPYVHASVIHILHGWTICGLWADACSEHSAGRWPAEVDDELHMLQFGIQHNPETRHSDTA